LQEISSEARSIRQSLILLEKLVLSHCKFRECSAVVGYDFCNPSKRPDSLFEINGLQRVHLRPLRRLASMKLDPTDIRTDDRISGRFGGLLQ
jgi:hypothetical protein